MLLCCQCSSSYKRINNRCIGKKLSSVKNPSTGDSSRDDYYNSFSLFDRFLFNRFANSVYIEIKQSKSSISSSDRLTVPADYNSLIKLINYMTYSRSTSDTHKQGTNMLVRLFPSWLLPQYKWMFATPFPSFSAWMNSWVTHYTTYWLMGPSKVMDLELPDNTIGKDQLLLVEKCRFLETSGCLRTCINACKIPTQNFFLNEMNVPVTLRPNVTDYSCRFEFGVTPLPIEYDDISKANCLDICSIKKKSIDICSASIDSV